jgi:Leucine-rich repeat (LRR) protein
MIERIPSNAFAMNLNLNFLALQKNKITKVEGIKHLPNLQFLDLSENMIEEIDIATELPASLIFLKLIKNPI